MVRNALRPSPRGGKRRLTDTSGRHALIAIGRLRPARAAAGLALVASLAACAGKPLPIPTRPPAEITPVASVAPSPTVAPTPGPGEAAIEGLRSRIKDGSFAYVVSVKGDVLATISDLTLRGSVSMSGKDAASTMSYTFSSGGRSTVQTRIVDGKRWVRVDNSKWKSAKLGTSSTIDPFAGALTAGAMGDAGPKKVGGKALRAVTINGGRLLDLTTIPAYNLTEERITSAVLTVYVDASGKPISGQWTQRGQGRVSGQLQEIDVDVDLTFSRVGGAVTVSAP
jgi:hypothetical protein